MIGGAGKYDRKYKAKTNDGKDENMCKDDDIGEEREDKIQSEESEEYVENKDKQQKIVYNGNSGWIS